MVEQARGSSYTQIVYARGGGKLALMNGQTLQKAFCALPGGGAAVYTSSGLAYYGHTDWLGSSRFASTAGSCTRYQSARSSDGTALGPTLAVIRSRKDEEASWREHFRLPDST